MQQNSKLIIILQHRTQLDTGWEMNLLNQTVTDKTHLSLSSKSLFCGLSVSAVGRMCASCREAQTSLRWPFAACH